MLFFFFIRHEGSHRPKCRGWPQQCRCSLGPLLRILLRVADCWHEFGVKVVAAVALDAPEGGAPSHRGTPGGRGATPAHRAGKRPCGSPPAGRRVRPHSQANGFRICRQKSSKDIPFTHTTLLILQRKFSHLCWIFSCDIFAGSFSCFSIVIPLSPGRPRIPSQVNWRVWKRCKIFKYYLICNMYLHIYISLHFYIVWNIFSFIYIIINRPPWRTLCSRVAKAFLL